MFSLLMKLLDKVAIITGGGKGIGRAIALAFAREGADISLAARSTKELEAVAENIHRLGRKASVNTTDLTKDDQVTSMVEDTLKEFGRIDLLVNNSGIAGPTAHVFDITPEEWDYTFAVNLRGVFLCCRAVVPAMIKRGKGKIINISSVGGKFPMAMRSPYCSTKMGLIGLTRSLASELGRFNINVNAISPSAVEGERMNRVWAAESAVTGLPVDELRKQYVSSAPLRKLVHEEDVAQVAVFLASDDSNMMTGQDINVCGGIAMS
jgi:NAD(P)-dependent dehydrogenase (short-subunit alcohol dehydrogenase family)